MKIRDEVIDLLKYGARRNLTRARLMREFDVSEQTVMSWANENAKDGELTRVTAVKLLAEELGLAEDAILTEV